MGWCAGLLEDGQIGSKREREVRMEMVKQGLGVLGFLGTEKR